MIGHIILILMIIPSFVNYTKDSINPIIVKMSLFSGFIVYIGLLFKSLQIFQLCPTLYAHGPNYPIYFSWIKIECLVFALAILSIFLWLLIKVVMQKCGKKFKYEQKDYQSGKQHDQLAKMNHDVQMLQAALTNLGVAIYLIYHSVSDIGNWLNAVAGLCGLCLLVLVYGFSIMW